MVICWTLGVATLLRARLRGVRAGLRSREANPSLLGVSELEAAHGFGGLGEVGDPFFELGMLGVLADEFDEIGGGWGGVDALVEEVQ